MSRLFAVVLLVPCFLSACALHKPSTAMPSSDWTVVTTLRLQTRIEADLADGRRVRGAVTAVSGHELVLDLTTTLRREDVLRLWIVRGPNERTGVFAGAAIGLIIGSILEFGGFEAVVVPAILATLGSTIGAAVGRRSPRKELVYARPSSPKISAFAARPTT